MQTPKRDQFKIHTNKKCNPLFFVISSRATLRKTLTAKNNDILPRTPKSEIYTFKRDNEHPCPFHVGVLPPYEFS